MANVRRSSSTDEVSQEFCEKKPHLLIFQRQWQGQAGLEIPPLNVAASVSLMVPAVGSRQRSKVASGDAGPEWDRILSWLSKFH
ncbi:Hypothetical predicted protein [Podarcis lilfordi]|uniref:Uncharacterized protein n=1 Tax=Podarcis lilfordi TaxID=74358 RepID=A0AA35K950_9SAUR|nr:Hypothetical predicted protein [Podarcis lilfordi]